MSTTTIKISRPTTVADRDRFNRLPEADRNEVKALALKAAKKVSKASEAWAKAFQLYSAKQAVAAKERNHGGGMPAGHHFQRVIGHRLVTLRKTSGECSCGQRYVGTDPADVRGAHAAHKAQDAA